MKKIRRDYKVRKWSQFTLKTELGLSISAAALSEIARVAIRSLLKIACILATGIKM